MGYGYCPKSTCNTSITLHCDPAPLGAQPQSLGVLHLRSMGVIWAEGWVQLLQAATRDNSRIGLKNKKWIQSFGFRVTKFSHYTPNHRLLNPKHAPPPPSESTLAMSGTSQYPAKSANLKV